MSGTNASGSRTALKIISVIVILFALLCLMGGIMLIVGTSMPAMTDELMNIEGQTVLAADAAMAFGVVTVIIGLVNLVIGFLGWRGAKRPAKIGAFLWISIIGFALSIVGLVVDFMSDTMIAPASVIQIVLIVVCLFLALNIRRSYRSFGE